MTREEAKELIKRDADETLKHGQHTSDTFHLSDFFIHYDNNSDKIKYDLWRILDLIFGKPYITPTFDEFAMFMAFSSALRSADLSRQVGAVIAKKNQIIATGANDTPCFGGGLYWPDYGKDGKEISDAKDGRDYMRGQDSNAIEKNKIIDDILLKVDEEHKESLRKILKNSRLKDITEYGRVVHAEMEALLSCTRAGNATEGATLYSTTFPCHNCAKHIVAAAIRRVVYIEPYPKSKALEFHSDSIALDCNESDKFVVFEPFVGVGPRNFINFFSINMGAGYPLIRKDANSGCTVDWSPEKGRVRMQLLPCSYLEKETIAASLIASKQELIK